MGRIIKFLLIIVLITMVACSGGGDDNIASGNNPATERPAAPTIPPNAEPALPLNNNGSQVVARVNDSEITLHTFQRALSRVPNIGNIASYDAMSAVELDRLIDQMLINQVAADWGIVITDEEIEAEYQAARQFAANDADWQAWLDENVYTEEEFRQSLHDNLITQRVQGMVIDYTAIGEVTEIHARHILVQSEEEANVVLTRLDAGESFEALSTELSLDPTTRDNGGDLGWFVRDDLSHVPELVDLALQLQPGQRGGPISTMLGYHVVETLEIRNRPATDAERSAAGAEQFDNWLRALRERAVIERYNN